MVLFFLIFLFLIIDFSTSVEAQWYVKLVCTHANCTPLICYVNVEVINIEATEEKL